MLLHLIPSLLQFEMLPGTHECRMYVSFTVLELSGPHDGHEFRSNEVELLMDAWEIANALGARQSSLNPPPIDRHPNDDGGWAVT